jgi:flagellar protein FliS
VSFTTTNKINHYNSIDSYTGVTDADPHQLVQMLLDGALKKISIVKGLMERGEIAKKGEVIGQAISIVGGLRSSLDLSAGGELAANLDDLYEFIERRLLEANLKNDVSMLHETSKLLYEIKSAWESIPLDLRTRPPTDLSVAS